eukprot:scaffold11511_cov116-Isochrysis_galbana.AAC.1
MCSGGGRGEGVEKAPLPATLTAAADLHCCRSLHSSQRPPPFIAGAVVRLFTVARAHLLDVNNVKEAGQADDAFGQVPEQRGLADAVAAHQPVLDSEVERQDGAVEKLLLASTHTDVVHSDVHRHRLALGGEGARPLVKRQVLRRDRHTAHSPQLHRRHPLVKRRLVLCRLDRLAPASLACHLALLRRAAVRRRVSAVIGTGRTTPIPALATGSRALAAVAAGRTAVVLLLDGRF